MHSAPLGGKLFKTTAVTKILPGRLKAAGQRRDWPTTEPPSLGAIPAPKSGGTGESSREETVSPYITSDRLHSFSKPQFPCNMELLGVQKTVLDCKILIKR